MHGSTVRQAPRLLHPFTLEDAVEQGHPRDFSGTFRRVSREGPDSAERHERAGQGLLLQHSMMFTARPPRTVSLYEHVGCLDIGDLGWINQHSDGNSGGTRPRQDRAGSGYGEALSGKHPWRNSLADGL